MWSGVQSFFLSWTDPSLLALVVTGTFVGVYVGAIPGITITMSTILLVSFTFSWEANSALCLMLGFFNGAVYGGSRTAILLNIPGNPAAIATVFDGYPLARKGRAGEAIGITTVMSVFGGILGVLALLIATPLIANVALSFQPRDYFLLCLTGILLVGTLSEESTTKGIFAGAFGVLLGMVGLDYVTAQERLTFGQSYFWSGVSPIVAMLGLFGVAEILVQMQSINMKITRQEIKRIVPSFGSLRKHWKLSAASSAIGTLVGALPGTGGDIASLIAYDFAKRTTKNPEVPFGEGAEEGLVAPEAANNAAVGGALIPMLSLGIPGDAVTAVILGALFVHGFNPGPMLMFDNPHLFPFFVGVSVLANLLVLPFGLTGLRLFVKVVEIPRSILYPMILVIAVAGVYAINNSTADVVVCLAFGVVGFLMRLNGYPVAPMVLGVVLSALLDQNWRRMLIGSQDQFGLVLYELFTSPLSLTLLALMIAMMLSQSVYLKRWT